MDRISRESHILIPSGIHYALKHIAHVKHASMKRTVAAILARVINEAYKPARQFIPEELADQFKAYRDDSRFDDLECKNNDPESFLNYYDRNGIGIWETEEDED